MAKGKVSRRAAPRIWLMTDPRLGDALLPSARALPRGSGIILRHYELNEAERRTLFLRLRRIARQRGHQLHIAGDARTARRWGADGVHGKVDRKGHAGIIRSMAVHDRAELRHALRGRADWLLISPVHPTGSHPGARPLRPIGFQALAIQAARAGGGRIVALGGMNHARFAMMRAMPVSGWAAIDALKKE